MRYALALVVTLAILAPGASSSVAPIEGATSAPACRINGIPYPQNALAAGAGSLWIACRDGGSVERRAPDGKLQARVRTPGFRPWSLAAAGSSIFVVDRDRPLLLRISARTNRVVSRIRLRETPIYVWSGAGSAWLAFDASGSAARVDARTGMVGRAFRVGDGPSGFASAAGRVWIAAHRDGSLVRVDGTRITALRSLPADERATPERLAALGGSLWVTGRGLDLVRADPETGAVRGTTEIGAAGIDVAAVGARVAVVSATPAGAKRGDPLVAAVAFVDPASGAVERTLAAHSVSLTGLASLGGRLVVFDGLHGRLLSARP